jgi:crotonobetainyl-CoA:carnitine CoA-transferase CaiB-like acyl-CoA transferase
LDAQRGSGQGGGVMVAGALEGVRVVELTHAWAGPYCGMMLADMGAEVIKLESPRQEPEARGGYPYVGGESVIFMMLHRNKKSLTLDLKSAEGKKIFLDLLATTDIVIQNFRPGVMERLGLGYDTLRKANPALIYATLSGYGSSGPKAGLPGVNMIALAESGLAATTMHDGLPPVPLGYALCDVVASMWASHGILSAYVHRLKTGEGQEVDMSLLEAGVSLMFSPVAMMDHARGDWSGRNSRTDGNAPSGFFLTSDGSYFAVFASYPALWDRFVEAMGLQYLARDPRFATREERTANASELHKIVGEIFLTQPTGHWVKLLVDAGVPAAPVASVAQMTRDDQVVARDMIVEQQHPKAGNLRVVGVPVKLSATPGTVRTPAPSLGEHTTEVLSQLGYADQLERLKEQAVI